MKDRKELPDFYHHYNLGTFLWYLSMFNMLKSTLFLVFLPPLSCFAWGRSKVRARRSWCGCWRTASAGSRQQGTGLWTSRRRTASAHRGAVLPPCWCSVDLLTPTCGAVSAVSGQRSRRRWLLNLTGKWLCLLSSCAAYYYLFNLTPGWKAIFFKNLRQQNVAHCQTKDKKLHCKYCQVRFTGM